MQHTVNQPYCAINVVAGPPLLCHALPAAVCLCGVDRENQQSPSSEIYSTKKAFNLGTHSVMIVQGSLQLNESVTQFKRRASANTWSLIMAPV